jgi:hypothetical protein
MILVALYSRSNRAEADARSTDVESINETIPALIDLIAGQTPAQNGQGLFPDWSTFF